MKKDFKTVESINIKNYREFINIEGSYGSHQKWLYTYGYRRKFWSNRSCGVSAAANIAYYLSKNHNKKLYISRDLNRKSFTRFLNEISKFIRPRLYGIPTIYHMKKGFINFARSKAVDVETRTIDIRSSNEKIIEFIKEGLRDDYPILMITWNTKTVHLKYHWVTITGYFKDEDGSSFIVTSNWGRREVFNIDKWLSERSIYKGLIYFK